MQFEQENMLMKFFSLCRKNILTSENSSLLSNSIWERSFLHYFKFPRFSAKICCRLHIVLHIYVSSFSITSCAFLSQRFEILTKNSPESVPLLLLLNQVTNCVAAVARAQVYQYVIFYMSVSSDPGSDWKYECNFFLWRLFNIFLLEIS